MNQILVTKVKKNIYQLLSYVNDNCQPIIIINRNGKNGVLISENDWNVIQETLYLNSINDIIIDGMNTNIDDCIDENNVKW